MKATITIDPYRVIGQIDPKIYGQFLSRRRGVADGGLYAPDHPDADETGLRRQVVEAVAATAPPIVRWPGGCTGTSYEWLDGVGPAAERPRTIDAHFGYDVGNGFGTAEFVQFCRRIGAEPHINLNTGTGTLREALAWVEYTNGTLPSRWANLRRAHGYEAPFNVRYWQLGNEEYGHWEIGYRAPADYAALAREWAKAIKHVDAEARVLAVSGAHVRATAGIEWDVQTMLATWPYVDYFTAHRYWNFNAAEGFDNYDMIAGVGYLEEQSLVALGGLLALVGRQLRSTHRPRLAITEWNCRDQSHREMSPAWRPTDTQYRLVDALACAGFLNAMQRQCRLVGLATFAQTVNVVGMLVATAAQVVRETVYWALAMQRHHSGTAAVDAWVECDGYSAEFEGRTVTGIPYLDVSATLDESARKLFLSIVNRHRADACEVQLRLRDTTSTATGTLHQLWHADPLARNTLAAPDAITPTTAPFAGSSAEQTFSLPPHSYTIVELPV
jgi:alpha-N-arabinofuranosidase